MSENKITRLESSSKGNPLLKKQTTSQKNLSKQPSENKKNNIQKKLELKQTALQFLYRKTKEKNLTKFSVSQLSSDAKTFFVNAMNSKDSEVKQKNKKDAPFYDASVQDFIPLKEVRGGMMITTDNRYISMVEIMPINFYNKSADSKKTIQETFGSLFHNLSAFIQIKAMNDITNPSRLIEYVREQTGESKDQKIIDTLNDYIQTVMELSKGKGVTTRFFIFYEYTGNQEGRKSNDINEIYQTMLDNKRYIYSTMAACGHICYVPDDYNMEIGEFLYYFFNRNSSKEYTLHSRINRLRYDEQEYNKNCPPNKRKKLLDVDLIAPKGLYFINREYVYMDGLYYAYLSIKDDDHPQNVSDEWLSNFIQYGKNVDLDIILRRLPHDFSMMAIKQINKFADTSMYGAGKHNKKEKVRKLGSRIRNNSYVHECMQKGEHLYDCMIFITLKATTKKRIKSLQRRIIKDWSNYMKFEDSYLATEEFFHLSMPFLQKGNDVFRRNKHNYLDRNLTTLYMFTSYSLFDFKGYVLGKEYTRNSIVAPNNFNTHTYSNANMVLLGTSGAGKTFTEQLIAQRMLMTGIRDYFIIPKKGYEYRRGCNNVNGAFISLSPGSPDCVNVLEIRPEKELDADVLADDISSFKKNMLAHKTTSLILWIQLLMGKEKMSITQYNELSIHITLLYESFGITSDPNSIYEDGHSGTLKKMPIISDLYQELCKSPILKDSIAIVLKPFIKGICDNMNGQTNVDLYNNYTVFDVDEDVIGADLLPSFLYIAFDFVYSSVKEREGLGAIFLDEVWKMMRTEECAEQVSNMVKLVRGYGGCTIMATQELNDFMSASKGFGKSVINNSELKLLLKMKEDDLRLVSDTLQLTETDKKNILRFPTGTGMLIANGDKVTIEMISSKRELRAFNTDKTKEILWAQEDRTASVKES